jgi:hypothetical protein
MLKQKLPNGGFCFCILGLRKYLMKNLYCLSLLFVLIIAGCGHSSKQAVIKPVSNSSSPTPNCDSLDKIVDANDKDTIFLNHDKDDLFWVTRSRLKNMLKKYPELGDTSFIRSPDETLTMCNIRENIAPCPSHEFDCEVCSDYFFNLYAYLLKQHTGDKPYQGKRDTLTRLYSSIVNIYQISNGGGTGFGHMYGRIPGYVEYDISEGIFTKFDPTTYNIGKQKSLYIRTLKQQVVDEVNGNDELLKKEKITARRELVKTVNEIDGLISSYFYLSKTQQFQYTHY